MVYFMGLIYLWPLQSGLSHFWDGDRNSYDNDYLLERAMNKMVEKTWQ
jgi:hypothetical protein